MVVLCYEALSHTLTPVEKAVDNVHQGMIFQHGKEVFSGAKNSQ
ncbi:MAG: hypothetical protein NTV00_15650 [Methylococcales bacterium]|nr:hypothetical protein [Methylococcales bacterium]